jgi:cytochrome c peroxidase
MKIIYRIALLALVLAISCSKVETETFGGFNVPPNFPAPVYNTMLNKVTESGFKLGKKLFYDPILSADNTISCASCHIPSSAFTQHGHDVSHGINDLLGVRNSPPIMNLAWYSSYMWDGGIRDLDLQPIAPITSHVEMGETMENVQQKLQGNSGYKSLFRQAFGSEEVTNVAILKSLSQFMIMCISSNSKYDSVMRKQKTFTQTEEEGYRIFQSKCNSCHTAPLFFDNTYRNNGLRPSLQNDIGREMITLRPEERYAFKVPSLRNLTYTAPYMHDGRFLNLDAVLEHYNSGVHISPTLDNSLKQDGRAGIVLTAADKEKLIAFLNTLNDRHFVTNKLIGE